MRISDWSSDVCSSDLGRDVHFIAFLGAGGLLRRPRNGGEHRGDGGHGNETQSRTHITLPVAEDAPADDATDSCFCLAILYAREGRTPSEVGSSCSTSPLVGEAASLASLLASCRGGGGISAR